MDDILAEAQHNIAIRRESRLREQRRCVDICKAHLQDAVMSKYASRKECDAARSIVKAIIAEITLDEKTTNVNVTGATQLHRGASVLTAGLCSSAPKKGDEKCQ